MFGRHRQRLSSDITYARRQQAPRAARAGLKKAREALKQHHAAGVYEGIWQSITEYFGHRFNLPAGQVDVPTLEQFLDTELSRDLEQIFNDCEIHRYASAGDQADLDKGERLLAVTERLLKQCERRN